MSEDLTFRKNKVEICSLPGGSFLARAFGTKCPFGGDWYPLDIKEFDYAREWLEEKEKDARKDLEMWDRALSVPKIDIEEIGEIIDALKEKEEVLDYLSAAKIQLEFLKDICTEEYYKCDKEGYPTKKVPLKIEWSRS